MVGQNSWLTTWTMNCPGCSQRKGQKCKHRKIRARKSTFRVTAVLLIYGSDIRKLTASTVKLEQLRCLASSKILRAFQGKEQRAGGEKVNEGARWNEGGRVSALTLVPILCFLRPFLFSTIIWRFISYSCGLYFTAVYSYLQVVLFFDLSFTGF